MRWLPFTAAVAVAAICCSPAIADDEPNPVGQALIACAPTTYNAAIACLKAHLPEDSNAVLRAKDGPIIAHHGLGTFLRNNWGLWKGRALAQAMREKGFQHPDDMSGAILSGYAASLRGETFDVDAEAATSRAYWQRAAVGQKAMDRACSTRRPVPVGDGTVAVCDMVSGTNVMHFEKAK